MTETRDPYDLADPQCPEINGIAARTGAAAEAQGLGGEAYFLAQSKAFEPLLKEHVKTCNRCRAYQQAAASSVAASGALFAVVAVVQLILHYLGWLGVVLGVVAVLFGNWDRGIELLIGGFSLVVLKFVIGGFFLLIAKMTRKRQE